MFYNMRNTNVLTYLSTYNIILGQLTLNKLKATTSIYYLNIKFPLAYGIKEIWGDQVLTRECYQVALASGENHTWMTDELEPIPKLSEALQDIEIILGDPSKVLKIGFALSTSGKTKIINFRRKN